MTKIPPFLKSTMNIAFNINTDDDIVQKWQKALDDIKADGTYDRIMKKYK
jgi:ABC-type amino acid transport substrate-binding protein